MVQDDIKILDRHNRLFFLLRGQTNDLRDLTPSLFDVFDLIDVKLTTVGSHLLPNIIAEGQFNLFVHELEGHRENIEVRSWRAVDQPRNTL